MVKQARSDADTLIVETALEMVSSKDNASVVVVGTDTDILVMLIAKATEKKLFMLCCGKPDVLYSIRSLQQALENVTQHILFIHTVTGCYTTSALYNQAQLNESGSHKPDFTHSYKCIPERKQ